MKMSEKCLESFWFYSLISAFTIKFGNTNSIHPAMNDSFSISDFNSIEGFGEVFDQNVSHNFSHHNLS